MRLILCRLTGGLEDKHSGKDQVCTFSSGTRNILRLLKRQPVPFSFVSNPRADGKQKVPAVSSGNDRHASEEVPAQQNGHPQHLPGLFLFCF